MSNVQMFWSLYAECIEFLSQRRNGTIWMESRHEEVKQINRDYIREKGVAEC